ncbi:ribosome silencing factor [Lichenihabitans sp. PAMC28606]|nr:ribosome silencing factor [Lichenihabitans sp. PAMC28606]
MVGRTRHRGCRVVHGCEGHALATSTILEAVSPKPAPSGALPDSDQIIRAVLDSLDDAKADEVLPLDLRGKTSLCDMMVIATGRSTTHVSSIADRVTRACKDLGVVARVEGLSNCDWVLVDAHDVIVHIFRAEVRQFYNLEKLWGVDRPDEKQADRDARRAGA